LVEQAPKWTPAAKGKWLAGTVIFVLGVLLQVVQDYVHSPLGMRARTGGLALMALGVGLLFWRAKSLYES